jgi:hypothetical protein
VSEEIVLSAARWWSVKYWQGGVAHRDQDEADRAALSTDALREAGFLARVSLGGKHYAGSRECYSWIRVEVYGEEDIQLKARNHLRGFWNAIESRGLTPEYQEGFATGVRVLKNVGLPGAKQIPMRATRQLKA